LTANPSAMRPLIDLHHIELFLVWCCFWRASRGADISNWLQMLSNRLFTRRSGLVELPFIEGRNSTELVFECVARGEKPDEFCDVSSVYLTCLMEMTCILPPEQRDPLLEGIYRRLVLGRADCGTPLDNSSPIDLMGWCPQLDWGDRVLTQSLAHEGECTTIQLASVDRKEPSTGREIADALTRLVAETRNKREFTWPDGLPMAVILLACSKHRSPLPPEFWRRIIFPQAAEPHAA